MTEKKLVEVSFETLFAGLSVLISLAAIYFAYFEPIWEKRTEDRTRLVVYRNLACFAARVVTANFEKLHQPQDWNALINPREFEVAEYGLKQISIGAMPFPSIVESFIDISYSLAIAKEMFERKEDPNIIKEKIIDLNERMKIDISHINIFVDSHVSRKIPREIPGNCKIRP